MSAQNDLSPNPYQRPGAPRNHRVRILTHHFNRPDFIRYQHYSLQKFLKDDYELIVFNDAKPFRDQTNEACHKWGAEINQVCRELGIRCIRVPQHLHKVEAPSRRTGTAVDWSLKHYGYNYPGIVTVLDADMFIVKSFSIQSYLGGHDLAAVLRMTSGTNGFTIRYLWNGLLFFQMPNLPDPDQIRFLNDGPVEGLPTDTGGCTHYYLENHPDLQIRPIQHLISGSWSPDQIEKMGFTNCFTKFMRQEHDDPEIKGFGEVLAGHIYHNRAGGNWNKQSKYFLNQRRKNLREAMIQLLGEKADPDYSGHCRRNRKILVAVETRGFLNGEQLNTWLTAFKASWQQNKIETDLYLLGVGETPEETNISKLAVHWIDTDLLGLAHQITTCHHYAYFYLGHPEGFLLKKQGNFLDMALGYLERIKDPRKSLLNLTLPKDGCPEHLLEWNCSRYYRDYDLFWSDNLSSNWVSKPIFWQQLAKLSENTGNDLSQHTSQLYHNLRSYRNHGWYQLRNLALVRAVAQPGFAQSLPLKFPETFLTIGPKMYKNIRGISQKIKVKPFHIYHVIIVGQKHSDHSLRLRITKPNTEYLFFSEEYRLAEKHTSWIEYEYHNREHREILLGVFFDADKDQIGPDDWFRIDQARVIEIGTIS